MQVVSSEDTITNAGREDSDLSYNIFLGRMWIRAMKEISSTLHRIIKFTHNNKIHTIKDDPTPYDII